MTEQSMVSDQQENGSANPQETQEPTGQQSESQSKSIDPRDHARAVQDMKRYKGELLSLREQNETLIKKLDDVQSGELKKNEQYKELADQLQHKLDTVLGEKDQIKTAVIEEKKKNAAFNALKDIGFTDKYAETFWNSLPTDLIDVEYTSTGKINPIGVDDFVNAIKTNEAYQPLMAKQKVTVNAGNQATTPSGVTPTWEDYLKLEDSKKQLTTRAARQAVDVKLHKMAAQIKGE